MKLIVDHDLCQRHAVCTMEAPELFEIDTAADRLVIKITEPGPEHRAAAERAVKYCPNGALELVE